jgi:hypothetical protein
MPPALPPNSRASPVVCRLPIPNNRPSFSSGRLRRLFPHFALLRVDAAWPRLGRAFRTAPVSRQTNPNRVWHSPRFHSRPATLLRPPLCPFHRSALFPPAAALVKKETSRKRQKGKKHEIRRSQHTNERGRGFPRCSIGVWPQ